jgi:hypothetical protein
MKVRFDKAKFYQGEKLGEIKGLPAVQREPVKFYQSKCETKNFFSMLDESTENQKFNFIEYKYRDEAK